MADFDGTLADQILIYLRHHPGSTLPQVADAIGAKLADVSLCVRQLKLDGKVELAED